ncbi:HAMP domain-containing histidine kinase [Rossellomorea vietnamensis]|uniref:histidine kinase n=2 Tax=Rossellomorea TaxID=2837508 RepID=A0A5D4KDM1_9BACI|nr:MULTISPECIES: sensor histidine kinase [Rossellomorea]TYR74805.1 HAMP domain-containing histidine kinase [Rossellomorea vietnamensis]TYS78296.1 HAMP domain-containing histidine kinase [Rossellomorea aquimaris]
MIRLFLRERLSWISLYLFFLAFLIFVSYIDPAIRLQPVLYFSFLALLIFSIFLAIRYNKETKFFKELIDREDDLDPSSLVNGSSPFEKIVEESLAGQSETLRKSASQNNLTLEQEKDDLLSWIHEVKTPLTAMHLIIGRIGEQPLKSALTYEWLRIHMLLDQQLHQKRISFIENDLYIEKVDLEELLYREIKMLQSWCIQKGIGFDIDLKACEVLSDAKWLAFILRQILSNAVKYSDKTDIRINSNQEKGTVTLKIQDFGRGINPKDLPRIYEKGFTSTTDHQDSASTGMGLYLAKKAAEPLHLDLHVKSAPGAGTTFTLTFPKENDFTTIRSM